jgi:hypothetical protein
MERKPVKIVFLGVEACLTANDVCGVLIKIYKFNQVVSLFERRREVPFHPKFGGSARPSSIFGMSIVLGKPRLL